MATDYMVECRNIALDNIGCSIQHCKEIAAVGVSVCCIYCEDQMVCPRLCKTASEQLDISVDEQMDQEAAGSLARGTELPISSEPPRPTNRPEEPTVILIKIPDRSTDN